MLKNNLAIFVNESKNNRFFVEGKLLYSKDFNSISKYLNLKNIDKIIADIYGNIKKKNDFIM
jgi:hypothetical protein